MRYYALDKNHCTFATEIDRIMKKWLLVAVVMMMTLTVGANDGVFFVNGNHLVPVQETDIALTKEVLTISLCDDGYATVDVQYVLTNRGKEKTVTMGFEAGAPYNDEVAFSPQGIHPYISDFTVVMNGEQLSYMNAVVKTKYNEACDFLPLNLNKWKSYDEVKMRNGEELPNNSLLYNTELDSLIDFAYAYYFIARFKPGQNTIHQRWANQQIDDFTLRIEAKNTAKHFFVEDSIFSQSPFVVTEGVGKVKKTKNYDELFVEIALRNGAVTWHAQNFRPKDDMNIQSAERLHYDDFKLGTFYDRSDRYMPGSYILEDSNKCEEQRRILTNLPFANRGYVFKDKKLQKYFSQFFWYMPDPSWKTDTRDFTPREWRLIK